jgi:hypothetical protein
MCPTGKNLALSVNNILFLSLQKVTASKGRASVIFYKWQLLEGSVVETWKLTLGLADLGNRLDRPLTTV